uniref:Uncharacterized protein n=1 Tax=Arundo donax TaxID=35708 RepID=A0A0A9GGF9_ARUDO
MYVVKLPRFIVVLYIIPSCLIIYFIIIFQHLVDHTFVKVVPQH